MPPLPGRMKTTIAVGIMLLLPATWLLAEPADQAIRGVVLDESGAVVPGAEVVLKGQDGAAVSSLAADAGGTFSFERVATGRYNVEVRHEGFKPSTARVVVDARARPSLRVVLQIAPVAEEVTVGQEALSTGSQDNRDAVSVDQKLLQAVP